MIGTRLDEIDAARVLPSKYGKWLVGNGTWTLVARTGIDGSGKLSAHVDSYLRNAGAFDFAEPKSFALTVLTSTACNLGCGYCFQNTELDKVGQNRHIRIPRDTLESDTIGRIVEFTRERMVASKLDKLFLLLFGGEPLLNRRGCLKTLQMCSSIGMSSSLMATNGVLLYEDVALELQSAGLTAVQITFDGRRLDHDHIRVTRHGKPTFINIVNNLNKVIASSRLGVHLRVNVSKHNIFHLGEICSELVDAGVNAERCGITFAWVGDAGFGFDNSIADRASLRGSFLDLHKAAIDHGFRLVWPGAKSTCQICSVPGGRHGAVVSADGSLYSCWQSAGKPHFAVGDVSNGYGLIDDNSSKWVRCGYEYNTAENQIEADDIDWIDGSTLDYLHEGGKL